MPKKRTQTEWKHLIEECEGSGRTRKSWCEERKIKRSTYYYWYGRLKKQKSKKEMGAQGIGFAELPRQMIKSENREYPKGIKIHYKEYSLEVFEREDMELAAEALRVLEGLC